MFANIWKIMKENKFEVDNEITNDLTCGICNCLIIKACNAPCGCRFCSDCIEHYLEGNDKFCPGTEKFCKVQVINFTKDVSVDHPINLKISQVTVKCPRQNCQFKDELYMIENHMHTCIKRQICCPFNAIGCEMNGMVNDEMKDHLIKDNYCHSKLMIDLINNLRYEMESMRNEIIELKTENRQFKQKFDNMELQLINQEQKIYEMGEKETNCTGEIYQLKEEMIAVRNENRSLRREIETNVELIHEIRQQIVASETKSQQQIYELKQNFEQQKENKQIEMEKCTNEIHLIKTNFESDELINFECFDWRIEKLSQQNKKEIIYSNPFYSAPSEYKMCLAVYICGGGIVVGFYLMRGEFDDKLTWPFKLPVTIDVVNPTNGNIYRSKTIKYSDCPDYSRWNKPSNDKNVPIWVYGDFTDHIPRVSPAVSNDLLQIKCKIEKL